MAFEIHTLCLPVFWTKMLREVTDLLKLSGLARIYLTGLASGIWYNIIIGLCTCV